MLKLENLMWQSRSPGQYAYRLNILTVTLSVCVLAVSSIVIVNWLAGFDAALGLFFVLPPMLPNAAL
ncbi:MAG: hypothetical protein AB7P49_18950, partial [Bdellovibrionales bacterium]